ncbi:MAG: ATP-binding protein [Bacteroidetes bacterium]|nr:ATP-binding protein [Bacteroidota bacterium]
MIPRHLLSLLIESVEDSPVILIHGPRQSGKTTLVKHFGEIHDYSYYTFDNQAIRLIAQRDPQGFISDCADRTIIDEIQRVPELYLTIKESVDQNRQPGRFILTGSSNLLLQTELTDALVGRMEILRLHPLSQREIEQIPTIPFLERLFTGNFKLEKCQRLAHNLRERIVGGGYPPALARQSNRKRSKWYGSYINSVVYRDILNISKIQSIEIIPRLLTAVGNLSAQLFNVSDLSNKLQMNRNTTNHYLSLLQHQFLIERLPAWHSNRMKRLIKTPKIHIGDTGLACHLMGVDANMLSGNYDLLGQLVESFVFLELKRQASSSEEPYRFYHFRDRDGIEVDMIIERGAFELVGIEIKASSTIFDSDFKGLQKLKSKNPDKFKFGAVLYDGETCASYGENMFIIPIRKLWESNKTLPSI